MRDDHRCDQDQICRRLGGIGDLCTVENEFSDSCDYHLYCDRNGTCVRDLAVGTLCSASRECDENFCKGGVCEGEPPEPIDYCDPDAFLDFG